MPLALGSINTQRGAVLFVSLILLLVSSIIAVSSMRGSGMQEKMVANQNQQSVALLAAETGAGEFWSWISSTTVDWDNQGWRDSWQNETSIPTARAGTPMLGDSGYYWIEPADVDWESDRVVVLVHGIALSGGGETLARTSMRLEFLKPVPEPINPAFMVGALAGGNLIISGNADITGSAHANGNFKVTGRGGSSLNDRDGFDEDGNLVTYQSTVSAAGTAEMSGAAEGAVISAAPSVTIPSAREYIDSNKGGGAVINSCSIPSGDLRGAIYYCDGNLTTSGEFSNGVILADGNISHDGSSQLGSGQELTVQMVASGNITIGGRNDTYGVIWADGDVTQNGRSTLGGSIVAGGNITRSGKFSYKQYDNFGSLPLPPGSGVGVTVGRWFEQR